MQEAPAGSRTPQPKTIAQRWDTLNSKKSTLISLSEEYSSFTLPEMFPYNNVENIELQVMQDPIGARGVNHLANKVVSTLFQPNKPFFRLTVNSEALDALKKIIGDQNKDKMAEALAKIDAELADTEKHAIEYLDMVTYRPQATNAAKLLIITGNALVYHPKGEPVQCFNLRDYCVVRDLSGTVIEILTKESKSFDTFKPSVQAQLRGYKAEYEDHTNVCIYTQIKLMDDGKYHMKQCADDADLDSYGVWTKDTLPWIALTWNLIRGEDYGRGLVGNYAGAFHALRTLHQALLNLAGIIADLKFLVNPASVIDIVALNNSPAGSYHAGKDGDVTAIQTNKNSDAQFLVQMIDKYERQIAEAFLLTSSATRDAERVTAEEIRQQAQELETSNGGIYSRLASTWQGPTANIALDQIGFRSIATQNITPKIVTGMDSLSRQSEMDNLRVFVQDLTLLEAVPDDIRADIDGPKFMLMIGKNRQVDVQQFLKSAQQKQAEQAAIQANQQAAQATNVQGQVAVEAGKAAVQEK